MKKSKIQRLELNSYDKSLHCLFCGKRVITDEDIAEAKGVETIRPCKHTLLIATDASIEYQSKKFAALMGSTDIEEIDESIDAFTDRLKLPNAIKIAMYQGAPSFFGAYALFMKD